MIPKDLRKYLNLGAQMHDTHAELYLRDEALNAEEKARLLVGLKAMTALCAELDLPTSGFLLKRAESDLPESTRELEVLTASIYAELKGKLFLFVPSYRAVYYEAQTPEWAQSPYFPSAAIDLKEAGNCFAAALYCLRISSHARVRSGS